MISELPEAFVKLFQSRFSPFTGAAAEDLHYGFDLTGQLVHSQIQDHSLQGMGSFKAFSGVFMRKCLL